MKLYERYNQLKSSSDSCVEYYEDSCVVMGLNLSPSQIVKQYQRGEALPTPLPVLPSEEDFVPRPQPRDIGEALQESVDFVVSVSQYQNTSEPQTAQNNPVSEPSPSPAPSE